MIKNISDFNSGQLTHSVQTKSTFQEKLEITRIRTDPDSQPWLDSSVSDMFFHEVFEYGLILTPFGSKPKKKLGPDSTFTKQKTCLIMKIDSNLN